MQYRLGTATFPGDGDTRDTKAFEGLTQSPKGSTIFRRIGRAKDGTKLTKV